jgi:L-seryl-tRNA(Ser) seleniumtransferase
MQNLFRAIPSVDASLAALHRADAALADSQQTPHALLRDLVAAFWDNKRASIRAGAYKDGEELRLEYQLPALLEFVQRGLRPRFRSVLNATGVVVHTNMGRSVLAEEARQAVIRAATGYCNLELDLATGGRGSRHALVEELICRITGAEAALVVNKGGEVVVSRGELVEIGGSFRIPEVMEKSGASLREVGATNRTHLRDYSAAINESTRALMRVHTSNYRIVGFHSAVSLPELSALAHEHGLPLIEDLGSGSLMDFSSCGLPNEPTVPEVLAQGADIATFSGDKVLGGPQAGIITGRKGMVDQLKRNPLTRALRCDKLCLSALEATLRLYLDPEKARQSVPTLRMITCPPAELAKAARSLANKLRKGLNTQETQCEISVREDVSRVGGGAFPQYDLPTTLVRIRPAGCSPTVLKAALLETVPPLIGRLEDDAFCLDPRTLDVREYPDVLRVLRQVLDTASRHTR